MMYLEINQYLLLPSKSKFNNVEYNLPNSENK